VDVVSPQPIGGVFTGEALPGFEPASRNRREGRQTEQEEE
jgi:hypothetical protein